jgi:protein SCO1/2
MSGSARRRPGRAIGTSLAVLLVATVTFWWGTDGLRAFTAESARRERVLRSPQPMPPVALEDQHGQLFTLDDYRGRRVAVEFVYTRCASVCRSLGAAFRQLRDAVPAQRLGSEFALLSLSFDPAHDDPAALGAWAATHGADGRHWRVARIADPARLRALLDAFGVMVIPDGLGGYEHNAAIHLLDAQGRLARISDIEAPRRFLADIGLGR